MMVVVRRSMCAARNSPSGWWFGLPRSLKDAYHAERVILGQSGHVPAVSAADGLFASDSDLNATIFPSNSSNDGQMTSPFFAYA